MVDFLHEDQLLNAIIEQIKRTITREDIVNIPDFQVEFSPKEDVKLILANCKKSHGIYLFEIANPSALKFKDWYGDFKSRWETIEIKHKPPVIQNLEKTHKDIKEWIPLYIGKSQNVSDRLMHHIEGYSSTSSLRLKQHKFLETTKFRVKVIYLDDIKNYDIIARIIESHLRQTIHPIVGKR